MYYLHEEVFTVIITYSTLKIQPKHLIEGANEMDGPVLCYGHYGHFYGQYGDFTGKTGITGMARNLYGLSREKIIEKFKKTNKALDAQHVHGEKIYFS